MSDWSVTTMAKDWLLLHWLRTVTTMAKDWLLLQWLRTVTTMAKDWLLLQWLRTVTTMAKDWLLLQWHGWEWQILVLLKNKKISSRGPGATQALVGSSHSFLHLFFFSSASISRALVVSLSWRNSMFQSLELLKEKIEEISRGVRGHAPLENFGSRD